MDTTRDTHELLNRIAGLRQRLEQAQIRGQTPLPHRTEGVDEQPGLARLWELADRVAEGFEHARQLNDAVRPLAPAVGSDGDCPLPKQLTARARRVLERGRQLLHRLRELTDHPSVALGGPLAGVYRAAAVMTDAALRLAPTLPDSASGQLHVAEGMEVILQDVTQRVDRLVFCIAQHDEESRRIDVLSSFLNGLHAERSPDLEPLAALAETLLTEATECHPLRFLDVPTADSPDHAWLSRYVACHSLTVAQVMARLIRHEPDLRHRAVEAVLAAMLYDAGMLYVPPAIIAAPLPLADDARRRIESHTRHGAELLARALPTATWLAEAALSHHERTDGTGYPGGLREHQVTPLARLLAVCDVYAAACTARPFRPARDPRTALTDVLLLAEKGKLDSHFAESLLHLSFYPIGAVVELADGAVGVVVATPGGRSELHAPAKPVVALLLDSHGKPLATPAHVDLLHCESRSVIRTVPAAERRRLLALSHPEVL